MAVTGVCLAVPVLLRFRKSSLAIRAVILCALFGALLTVLHPNQKSRFLHSWLPALWIASGAGAASLLVRVPRGWLRTVAATVGVAALAAGGGRNWLSSGRSPEMGLRGETRSLLDLSDAYLPAMADAKRVAFVSNAPCRPFLEWTFLQCYPFPERFAWPHWQDKNPCAETSEECARWIDETDAEVVVSLESKRAAGASTLLAYAQSRLRKNFTVTQTVSSVPDGISVTVWRRRLPTADLGNL
jgi:hypothetical protein